MNPALTQWGPVAVIVGCYVFGFYVQNRQIEGVNRQIEGVYRQIEGLSKRIDGLRDSLRSEMREMKETLRAEMREMRAELRAEIKESSDRRIVR